jgi:hypothetical protein
VEVADSTDFDFGTGAFLIEWREYRTSNTDYENPFSRGYNLTGGIFLQSQSPGVADKTLYFVDTGNVARAIINLTTGTSVINVWTAWAVQRAADGTIRLFKDGVQIGVDTTNIYRQLNLGLRAPFCIGSDSASSYWTRGYIDEFRVQKGVAPYTGAGYTVATSAFTYP